jgi:hypothetical protein
MIISNLKIFKTVPPNYLINQASIIREKVFKKQGVLIVKPSGKIVYRRELEPGPPPNPTYTKEQILQTFKSHMTTLKSNAEQLDSIKSNGTKYYKLTPLFDINNYHPPIVSTDVHKIGGRYIKKTINMISETEEVKDDSWIVLLNWKFDNDVTVKYETSIEKEIPCHLEIAYLMIAFNKTNIINLITTSVPIIESVLLENIDVKREPSIFPNEINDINIKYFRYLPEILLPILYINNKPTCIERNDKLFSIDDFIKRLIPDSVIPVNIDLHSISTGFYENIVISDERNMEKRIKIEQVADLQIGKESFPHYKVTIANDLKIVTAGLGAVERLGGLNPEYYNQLWKKGNTKVNFSVKDLNTMDYVASKKMRIGPQAEVNFNMELYSDPGVSIFNALNWMESNYLNRCIAILKPDECDYPMVDNLYFQYLEKMLTNLDTTEIIDDLRNNSLNFSISLFCIYWLKVLLRNCPQGFQIILTINSGSAQSSIQDPVLMEFLWLNQIRINDSFISSEIIEIVESESIVYFSLNKLESQFLYGIDRLSDFFMETFSNLFYGLKIYVNGSYNDFSSKIQTDLLPQFQFSYSWAPLAYTLSNYSRSRVNKEKNNELDENSIIKRKNFGMIFLNYSFKTYDPIDYMNKQHSSNIFFRYSADQYFEEILVHEVGHCLALANYHENNEIEYGYNDIGLSSKNKSFIYPTESNVIEILNDFLNRKKSIK